MITLHWAATIHGYTIQTCEDGAVTDEYNAGNNFCDSQSYVEPGSRNALPLDAIRMLAQKTVYEMAAELGVTPDGIEEDDDLKSYLNERYENG